MVDKLLLSKLKCSQIDKRFFCYSRRYTSHEGQCSDDFSVFFFFFFEHLIWKIGTNRYEKICVRVTDKGAWEIFPSCKLK